MPLTDPIPLLLPKFGYGISPHAGEVIEWAYSEPYPIPDKDALAPDIEADPLPIYDDLLCLILFWEDPIVDTFVSLAPGKFYVFYEDDLITGACVNLDPWEFTLSSKWDWFVLDPLRFGG